MLLIFKELFKHLPHERKLSKEIKDKACSLLEMKVNKKLVQQALCEESGSVILLKDLSNIALTTKQNTTRNDLDAVVNLLTDKYGKNVHGIDYEQSAKQVS